MPFLRFAFLCLGAAVLLYVIRRSFVAGRKAAPADLSGKTIVVTGASPGSIGFETARVLAAWGARVIVTTRSNPASTLDALRSRLDAPARERLDAHALDLSRAESVEDFAAWCMDHCGDGLDVLVNNAGVHLDLLSRWTDPTLTSDGHEVHWRTNYLGTAHLTDSLTPLLVRATERRGEARVVNVVSHLHALGTNDELLAPTKKYESWHAYGRSKLALVHATHELERRHGARGLHAYCLHPGSVYSRIADKGLEGSRVMSVVRRVLAPVEAFFLKTTLEGAQTSIHCASAPGLAGGAYYENCRRREPSVEASDHAMAKRLVEETETWIAAQRIPSGERP